MANGIPGNTISRGYTMTIETDIGETIAEGLKKFRVIFKGF